MKRLKRKIDPTQKEVVLALMIKSEPYTKDLNVGGRTVSKEFVDFKCPEDFCAHQYPCQVNTGFSNPFNHLCVCFGSKEAVHQLYNEALQEVKKKGGTLLSHFSNNTLNERQLAMHGYHIRLLVMKNLPLAMVEDESFREFSKFGAQVSIKTVREVIIQMVELVEEAISAELKQTPCGAIMHDGWTAGGMYYIGLFACYMRQIKIMEKAASKTIDECTITLLAVAPMSQVVDLEDDNDDQLDNEGNTNETAKFNAEAHVNFFDEMLKYYGLTLEWVRAVIASRQHIYKHSGCKDFEQASCWMQQP
jgi:hypothetical protein